MAVIVPSSTATAVAGNNSITFNTLANGVHSNCTIRVTDAASNASAMLNVSSFTIDNAVPIVTIDSVTPNPTNAGANLTWHSNENGNYSIRVGGPIVSTGTQVASGVI